MKRFILVTLFTLLCFSALISVQAHADPIDTVAWAPDSALDGTGTGTLAGGTITVNYSTVVAGNAGLSLNDNWNVSLATDGAVGSGATHLTGGIFGTVNTASPQLQTIAFSSNVTNPILYINFGDTTSSMNFSTVPISFLDSNNAQLTGSVVTFAGANNNFDDGFAALLPGSYGPGNPIRFTYSTTVSFDSTAFTIGLGAQATTPEPNTIALLGALSSAAILLLRRRK